jgi:hypothetical protein
MSYFGDPEITSLPFGRNGTEFFDIVYLGRAIPNYVNSDIARMLRDHYVFVFATAINQKEDSYFYGHVEIDLIKQEYLSYFNYDIMTRGKHHVYEGGTLEINPFLSIVEEENEHGKQIIAHLKDQKILEDYDKVKYIRDFRVLLVRDNAKNSCDNLPVLELGPEFQARLDLDRADERKKRLNNSLFVLTGLAHDYRGKPEQKIINETISLLKQKIDEASRVSQEAFERYLQTRNRNLYHHKSINKF